jgi:hypothetical protein
MHGIPNERPQEPSRISQISMIQAPVAQVNHVSQVEERSLPSSYLPRIKELAEEAAIREGIQADTSEAVFEALKAFGFGRELTLVQRSLANNSPSIEVTNSVRTEALRQVFPTIMQELFGDSETPSNIVEFRDTTSQEPDTSSSFQETGEQRA